VSQEALDDFRLFLPKYLSDSEQKKLFDELNSFPENIDKRFFSDPQKFKNEILQGDGFTSVLMPQYDDRSFIEVKGFLVSNSCDASAENPELFDRNLVFAPILSVGKWEELLREENAEVSIQDHITAIRNQRISSCFFLPAWGADAEDCFVRLDCMFSFAITPEMLKSLTNGKIFSLSNYGFYVLLFKLAVHFSRVQERIDRN
jgi:hypothetical protein